MAPLVALIVFLGVYPKPVLDRIEPAVNRWSSTSSATRTTGEPADGRADGTDRDGAGVRDGSREPTPTHEEEGD